MKISHIKISNILGIDELELNPGGFTQIAGKNGTGKTSVLEAIRATLGAGHDATLLRRGAEKGEVVLVLDGGMEISKTITESGSTTTIKRDGKKVPRPVEALRALTDSMSINPVDFLLAPKKDRARALLEAMPLEVDAKHLAEISGVDVKPAPGLHALHVINQVHQKVYDERTGINRAAKEKQSTINQLEAAIPPAPRGVEGSEEDLQGAINAAADNRDATLGKISRKLEGLRAETQTQIDAIRAKAQADIDAIKAAHAEQETKAGSARAKAAEVHASTIAPLTQQLAIIRNDREASGRRQQTLDTISTLTTELETLKDDAERQTQSLKAIEDYKNALLASLPIPGLEVRDGEIFRDGIPFDRLNTAQQVSVAVEVAKLRAADIGVICVDRIECLDSESLDAFRAAAIESGLQLFVTRVDDQEFGVSTEAA